MAKLSCDLHSLYEAAVQNVEADVDFIDRVFKKRHGRRATLLREDFCGTGALACEWVRRRRKNEAWGLDLDQATLEWGRRHRVAPLRDAASRVHLLRQDARSVIRPKVEVVTAFNFSFCLLKDRVSLRDYFGDVRRSLRSEGVFFLDLFGGTESTAELEEETEKDGGPEPDGRQVPPFTYIWEQARYNPVDHHMVCHIHFKLKGREIRRAFTYKWRLWTLPELREILDEAGFGSSEVYVEGWDEEAEEGDGVFKRCKKFDNEGSWIAYLVAYR